MPVPPLPASETCPFCDEDFLTGDPDRIYGCDVFVDREHGRQELVWNACCSQAYETVLAHGWERFCGYSLTELAQLILGDAVEVLDIAQTDTSTVVCRLRPVDPTTGTGSRTVSPEGWFRDAAAAVDLHHRHLDAPQGHKFSIAIYNGRVRVGVVIVGRPVSRQRQAAEPLTLEVTRLCTWGEPALRRNAASMLYAAAGRRAKALGFTKLVTATLPGECGVSLRAAGWYRVASSRGGSWSRPSRARTSAAPQVAKTIWALPLSRNVRAELERATAQLDLLYPAVADEGSLATHSH